MSLHDSKPGYATTTAQLKLAFKCPTFLLESVVILEGGGERFRPPPPPPLPCNLAGTVLPYYYSKVKQGHQEQQTEVESESRKTGLMTRGQFPAPPSNGNRLMDGDKGGLSERTP